MDLITVYTDIYNMRIELEKIKKPIGTRNSPARTCQDLHYGHPQMKDGFYWIDPNLGMPDDAVKVTNCHSAFVQVTSGKKYLTYL